MIPKHVAIILDGNGRWAASHSKTVSQGHLAGAENLETISDALIERGIGFLTVYAFSTENWNRSPEEVDYLMGLMKTYLLRNKKDAIRRKIRIRVIGNRTMLSDELKALIVDAEEATKEFDGYTMTFAISYGSRDEIVRAAKSLAMDAKNGILTDEQISGLTENDFSSYLDTAGLPEPDLLIRPGGELRISNFLLWQLAYTEFYFTDTYWPDFSVADLDAALEEYANRKRRFGKRM